MKLKQIPGDFQVTEIPLIKPQDKGNYAIYELTKINRNTEEAIQIIAKQLNIQRKNISYAGTKDKCAITKQYISIKTNPEKIKNFKHPEIQLNYKGQHDEPISLGRLKGNNFKITIRNLTGNEKIQTKKEIINYFHEQRFSKNNTTIGKLLLKKNYEDAINYLKEDRTFQDKIQKHLKKSKNDYVGALKTIPKKILTLYIHAYQSKLWNITVDNLKKQNSLPKEVPIPGFSEYETDEITQKIITRILDDEQITSKDFLNKDIPYLTIEGTTRNTKTNIQEIKINKYQEDELNENKKKLILEFKLGKGEYATNVIEQLFQQNQNKNQ